MQVIHRKKNIFLEKYGFFSDSDLFITYYENFKLCAVQSLIPRCFHSSENRRTFSEQHESTYQDSFESVTTSESETSFFSPDFILVMKEAPKFCNQTKGRPSSFETLYQRNDASKRCTGLLATLVSRCGSNRTFGKRTTRVICSLSCCTGEPLSKGKSPVIMTKRMTPKLHMSAILGR